MRWCGSWCGGSVPPGGAAAARTHAGEHVPGVACAESTVARKSGKSSELAQTTTETKGGVTREARQEECRGGVGRQSELGDGAGVGGSGSPPRTPQLARGSDERKRAARRRVASDRIRAATRRHEQPNEAGTVVHTSETPQRERHRARSERDAAAAEATEEASEGRKKRRRRRTLGHAAEDAAELTIALLPYAPSLAPLDFVFFSFRASLPSLLLLRPLSSTCATCDIALLLLLEQDTHHRRTLTRTRPEIDQLSSLSITISPSLDCVGLLFYVRGRVLSRKNNLLDQPAARRAV